MSARIRRITKMDMSSHKIVNCAETTERKRRRNVLGTYRLLQQRQPAKYLAEPHKKPGVGYFLHDAAILGQCIEMLKAYNKALSKAF